jgi:phosphoribosyl-ATP pyrophosphohydrolase/phosphoribosyl-AMP cyclohydrolase
MEEVDYDTINKIREATGKKIMYAGGVSSQEDISRLAGLNVDCVIGMAYYRNKINLEESFASLLDFDKNSSLIPTIVKDEQGQVLMLAYSTGESLIKALRERKGIYYSRSRKKLWMKGEASGNTQELLRVNTDCDKDSLLFTVRQKDVACHTGAYSCFGDKEFSFGTLSSIIKSRRGTGSFSDRLIRDDKMLKEKILEEAKEVAEFKNIDNLRWEIADLLYFVSILMEKNNLSFKDIENELKARDSMKKLIKTTKLGRDYDKPVRIKSS